MTLFKLSKLVDTGWKWVGTFKSREDLFIYKDKHLCNDTIYVEEFEVGTPTK